MIEIKKDNIKIIQSIIITVAYYSILIVSIVVAKKYNLI